MDEIVRLIQTAEKKTPVKVYVRANRPLHFENCHVFTGADMIVMGDYGDIEPVLARNADAIEDMVIECDRRNSLFIMLRSNQDVGVQNGIQTLDDLQKYLRDLLGTAPQSQHLLLPRLAYIADKDRLADVQIDAAYFSHIPHTLLWEPPLRAAAFSHPLELKPAQVGIALQ